MSKLLTFPSQTTLERAEAMTPEYMRPNQVPYAVVLEGILRDEECDEIQGSLTRVDPYSVKGCGALTREIVAAPCLDIIETAARNMNNWYFKYDLDPGQHSWLQTYEAGGDYHRHMDGTPGQMRKLTAVAILSHPLSYDGGRLKLHVEPKEFVVPKTRGTVVVFQHWVPHDVSPVTAGERQTINMGFWGPPFK